MSICTGEVDRHGNWICAGNQLTHPSIKKQLLPYTVGFGKHSDIAEAGCTSHTNLGFYIEDAKGKQIGFLNEELLVDWSLFEVIGK